jgi:O-antigen/teichoic acid export membrane protein
MVTRHALLYLGAKVFSAAINLAAVAVFTRLASAEEYGAYLLILAQAFVIYGFILQWITSSFFANYKDDAADAQIATAVVLTLSGLALAAILALAVGAVEILEWRMALAVLTMVSGITAFELGIEVARTRLQAAIVALTLVCRAMLTLSLGAAALVWVGTPVSLAVAVAVGNILGALPCLLQLARPRRPNARWDVAVEHFRFGWPLVIAFGATVLGENIDRLILTGVSGTAALGTYGAIGDIIKQGFGIFGAAISLAVVSIAKRAADRGDRAAARRTMETAFIGLVAVTALGGVFVIQFQEMIVSVVLGPEFRAGAIALVPYFLLAYALLSFRAFYFGQIIYFGKSSALELLASVALLLTVAGTASLLVPSHGSVGAAVALVCGQAAACLVFIIAGRRSYAMPIPLARAAALVGCAGSFLLAAHFLEARTALSQAAEIGIQLAMFAITAAFVAWRFDVLQTRQVIITRLRHARTAGRKAKHRRLIWKPK